MILYRLNLILITGICVFVTMPATDAAELPQTLVDCRALNSAVARLDCYDQAVDAHKALADQPSADVVAPTPAATSTAAASAVATSAAAASAVATSAAADAPATEISPEALFGKSVTEVQESIQVATGSKEIDRLESFVSELSFTAGGKAIITLDNGQVWTQIDSTRLRLSGYDKVIIRKASLGSFMLTKVGSKITMRVKRIS